MNGLRATSYMYTKLHRIDDDKMIKNGIFFFVKFSLKIFYNKITVGGGKGVGAGGFYPPPGQMTAVFAQH